MLNGISSILMSSGPPPSIPMGEGEEEKPYSNHGRVEGLSFADRVNHPGLPIMPAAFAVRENDSDMLSISSESNHFKRPVDAGSPESNLASKRNKTERSNSDNVLLGWGPNGNAVAASDAGPLHQNQNLLGSLYPNQIMQNNSLYNTTASSTRAPDNTNSTLGNDFAANNGGLTALLLRDQMIRNHAVNAMLLAKIDASSGQLGTLGTSFPALGSTQHLQQQSYGSLGIWGNQFQAQGRATAPHLQLQQIANMQSLNRLNERFYGNMGLSSANPSYHSVLNAHNQGNPSPEQLTSILRHLQAASNNGRDNPTMNIGAHQGSASTAINLTNTEPASYQVAQQQLTSQRSALLRHSVLDLPPCEDGQIEPHTGRPSFSLGVSEDPNWLSEFHCFVRSDLVEVYCASHDEVKARNNSISYQQLGIRCRFCAHMPASARSGRASAFPSSLRQIYQSFTMMLRDHFVSCEAIPASTLEQFTSLKNKPAQGATDSKRYWIYSARKIGMADSADGIMINQVSRSEGISLPSFGADSGQKWEDDSFRNDSLVRPSDRELVSEFLLLLMAQVQPIRLTETECIGNRRSLRVGLPGFGCRYCCEHRRLGLCRMFPARRRTLPNKVNDLYDHLRRCSVCPQAVKDNLKQTKRQMTTSFQVDQGSDREFFDRVWNRLGHSASSDSA
jgi:hypothetical protein